MNSKESLLLKKLNKNKELLFIEISIEPQKEQEGAVELNDSHNFIYLYESRVESIKQVKE